MDLRPYQKEAVEAVERAFKDARTALLVLPTGGGKTVVFSTVAANEVRRGGRVLVLAHRGELLEQAADKLRAVTGIVAGFEKAELTSEADDDEPPYTVVVGSVQSMCMERRLARFAHDDFSMIVVDECHHALTDTYRAVFDHFPSAKVLGVTATPDRGDLRGLGEVFETIAYEYSIVDAIRDGYLSPIRAQTVPLSIDLTSVSKQGGDYQAAGLGCALDPYLGEIVREIKARCSDRKTVVFTPLIATSVKMLEMFRAAGVDAREVNGGSRDRAETLKWFDEAKPGCVILNAMLLCLDEETEVLTDRGFVRHDEITKGHRVANWNFDGTVFFDYPKDIVHRMLEPGREYMVSIRSDRCDIRVTSTHRMVVACGAGKRGWKKIPAGEFTASHSFPTCGIAEPFDVDVQQESHARKRRNPVVGYSYNIRRQNPSMSFEDSRVEAMRRIAEKDSMRYSNPRELTEDECRFIGFWLADGSVSRLSYGGVEYTLAQSLAYPLIIDWIDRLLKSVGVDFKRKIVAPATKTKHCSVRWSIPRGTGGGSRKRRGLYSIEKYLVKGGTELFWGLDERQFDALVEGFWYGDGDHLDAQDGFGKSIYVSNTSRKLIDLLCSIGTVRNWRCRVSVIRMKNPLHRTQYGMRMIKGAVMYTTTRKTSIVHEDFSPERVWCVRTTSGNIITRRNGRVSVMGNTEGWDSPSADCVVVLRATKVRSLFCQMVGRGTRLSPGKKNLLLLDFLWMTQTHDLCRPSCLLSDDAEVQDAITERQERSEDAVDIDEAMLGEAVSETVMKREEALAKKLEAMRRRRGGLVDPLQYAYSIRDIDLTNYRPKTAKDAARPTMQQLERLEKIGFGAPETFGEAEILIRQDESRRAAGLTAPKQIRFLEAKGFRNVATWTSDAANRMIRKIVACGWRVPYGINVETYRP